ncbi:alpha/beta fold hydrolase [Sphingosinicella sp. BN140058]|uniref:alpha/beta fold hydrolase n=1 Tax=Sphingosinicella sp. BN140058 TaxID=1892855 RepID=UPI0013EE245D|nr:alpha/beta fold hydrolase [Sphingosinicella sp. BN140058]
MCRRSAIGGGLALALLPRLAEAAEAGVPAADRELRVKVKGGSLYVRVNGSLSGRPPILFVHGGPGAALWQFFPALPMARERGIILYDQLDSGRSDAPGDPANWTVDRFVDEIDAIRGALGVERLHLLGHSWGGIVANRYAARRPSGLKSLILQGAPLFARRAEASVQGLAAQLPDGAGDAVTARKRGDPVDDAAYQKASAAFMRRHVYRTDMSNVAMPYMAPTPEDRGNAVAKALVGDDLLAGFGGVLRGFDDEPLLGRVAVPTLLLRGEFDLLSREATRAVLPRLRHGRYAEIEGAGHMAQFDRPDAWRAQIAAFVSHHDR